MWKLVVAEIAGRQYVITPGAEIQVNNLSKEGDFVCDKILLMIDGDKTLIGAPYLSEKLQFEAVNSRGDKIRVAKFHAKANTRKVTGSRAKYTKLKLKSSGEDKNTSVKKS